MKCSLDISNFLEEVASLCHSVVFLYFFALVTEEGFLISCYSLELCIQMLSEVTQLCSTLCDPIDCSLRGFSVHGIFQARVLEWVAISFSRGEVTAAAKSLVVSDSV